MRRQEDQLDLFGEDAVDWEDLPFDARRRCLESLTRMLETVVREDGQGEC